MDYEIAYKEALERAKVYYDVDNDNSMMVHARGVMEHIFPELGESEDERIIKGLLSHLKELREIKDPRGLPIKTNEHYEVWIAWLEKQGRKFPEDEAKEMFIKAIEQAQINAKNGVNLSDSDKLEWWKDFKAYGLKIQKED